MARDVTFPDHVVEVPEKPVREPHGPRDSDSRPTARPPPPPPPPPAPPPIFHRNAYTGGIFVSGSGSVFGMGVEIQSGFFGELDMETGILSVGDFTSTAEVMTSNVAPVSGALSAGAFGGAGSASGFSGGGKSMGGSLTGSAGGVALSYAESDHDEATEAPYKGGSIAYTASTGGAGAEVNTTRSNTRTNVRESFNVNLENHVKSWIGQNSMPSMFGEWH